VPPGWECQDSELLDMLCVDFTHDDDQA
jgi:hypothetical protein